MARIKRRKLSGRCGVDQLPDDPRFAVLTEPLRRVQDHLDRNAEIIQKVNEIYDKEAADEYETSAELLRELNLNINFIVQVYSELVQKQQC
mmetsp:Transcript_15924/g.27426  ORF Transcript_15924/g.27426 Transcript_15924/m.27426 type:complete len:91 (+) Transcript_15924:66-338(+)|eukprot:CAMPEP_0196665654 /NCGR_PEP_ID=MMETSP1086-20130531/62048_1 /TAXON_ID=77921 /ORGANISM="Cyanoptyche  gloeocystis , Strain SAG4.97" /LENGTH=90 /DNA_ID=CAMNT_0042002531 /DNA_START=58 /DNA_END=330 /DNA_ORIENTATION=+